MLPALLILINLPACRALTVKLRRKHPAKRLATRAGKQAAVTTLSCTFSLLFSVIVNCEW
jgi:hypothetical protein